MSQALGHRLAPRVALASLLLLAACGPRDRSADGAGDSASVASASVDLNGVGATLPYPLYARWFNDYAAERGVRINYRSEGSKQGIAAAVTGNADFGATDSSVPDSVLKAANIRLLHIPMAVGAVAITYHVPGVVRPLRLTPELIVGLFSGRIRKWNAPQVRSVNPGVELPDLAVRAIFRSDGSGTAGVFNQYLTAIAPSGIPRRNGVPNVQDAVVRDGNEAVASEVKATPGSIAYLEVVYARQNRLPVAHVQNASGRFVSPMPFEIAMAAANTLEDRAPLDDEYADGFRISLVNARGEQAYPLASYTWLLVAPDRLSADKRSALSAFLHWAYEQGSSTASALGYVPLPSTVATQVLTRVDRALGCDPCASGGGPGTVP
ncbi:phosphate ABC transporter substrate-binding protein PstS [Gemmatimonas sp.]